jgi:hypothetical protein
MYLAIGATGTYMNILHNVVVASNADLVTDIIASTNNDVVYIGDPCTVLTRSWQPNRHESFFITFPAEVTYPRTYYVGQYMVYAGQVAAYDYLDIEPFKLKGTAYLLETLASSNGIEIAGGKMRVMPIYGKYIEIGSGINEHGQDYVTKVVGNMHVDGAITAASLMRGYPAAIKAFGTITTNSIVSGYNIDSVATWVVTLDIGFLLITDYQVLATVIGTTPATISVEKLSARTFEIHTTATEVDIIVIAL